MIARIQKSMQEKDNENGFTLIELLVVMIIIGILAAIAIPVFLNQRAKAADTSARSDVSTLGKEIATYYVDNTGAVPAVQTAGTSPDLTYTMTVGTTTTTLGPASDNVTAVAENNNTGNTAWCIEVTYTGGTETTVAYDSTSGLAQIGDTCTAGVAG